MRLARTSCERGHRHAHLAWIAPRPPARPHRGTRLDHGRHPRRRRRRGGGAGTRARPSRPGHPRRHRHAVHAPQRLCVARVRRTCRGRVAPPPPGVGVRAGARRRGGTRGAGLRPCGRASRRPRAGGRRRLGDQVPSARPCVFRGRGVVWTGRREAPRLPCGSMEEPAMVDQPVILRVRDVLLALALGTEALALVVPPWSGWGWDAWAILPDLPARRAPGGHALPLVALTAARARDGLPRLPRLPAIAGWACRRPGELTLPLICPMVSPDAAGAREGLTRTKGSATWHTTSRQRVVERGP